MLKWIALLLMIIDHFAYVFMAFIPEDYYIIMRTLGRLSFPIFVYYVALGLGRTSNLKKYMGRLLVFALISEIAIRSFEYFPRDYLNVIFSFFLYGLFYVLWENKVNIKHDSIRYVIILPLLFLIPHVEYGYAGFLIFIGLYYVNKSKIKNKPLYSALIITCAFLMEMLFLHGYIMSLFAGISGLLMFRKQLDKRVFPKPIEKWAFYLFYPLQWIAYGLAFSYVLHAIST